MFKVSEKHKMALQKILTHEEFENVFSFEGEEFFSHLDNCIVDRFVDDEPTAQSDALENIYYEIYNQNE